MSPSNGPSAENARPGPAGRLTSALEVLFCSGFPTQLAITSALVIAGVPVFTADGRLSLSHVVLLSVIDTACVAALVACFLRAHGESAQAIFRGGRPLGPEARLGLALIPAAFALIAAAALVIDAVAPWLRSPDGNPIADLLDGWPNIALFGSVAVLAGGFREEMQRAFVLHRFKTHLGGAVLGLALFSAAFGLGHIVQGLDAAIMTGLLGAGWGAVYLWRGSVVAPMVCHGAFNLIEVVYHGLAT